VFLNLLRTGDEVFRVTENNYVRHGLSQGRFGVLMLLKKRSSPVADGAGESCLAAGPLTPAELADAAGVTRATMTGLIDTLERDGLVKRVRDANDRRMMSVNLTPKGRKLLEKILPSHFRAMAGIMSPLKESERKTLVSLLNKILQHASTLSLAQAGRD
jgi:DNA-binding MarR family transcriptional regulator